MDTYLKKNMHPTTDSQKKLQNWFSSDEKFNQLYPFSMQVLANRHWTTLDIATKAADFLTENNGKVLDIGSGVGKFCLCAAHTNKKSFFYGIEQRKNLIENANIAKDKLGLDNVCFMHGNFTQIDFRNYDHFYFFNSFYENLASRNKIDDNIKCSGQLFNYYNDFLYRQLSLKPSGTRFVSLSTRDDEVPPEYLQVGSYIHGMLKFWIKQ